MSIRFRFSPINTVLAGMALVSVLGVTLFVVSQTKNSSPQTSQNADSGISSLSLPTLDSQTIALPGNTGQVTVAYSLALGCGDCVPGAKTLALLQPDYSGRNVRFIAIASDPGATSENLQPFLQAVGKNQLTWALDKAQKFTYSYQISELNIVIVFDGQGHEIYRAHLSSSDTALRAVLDKLLAV